MPSIVPGNDSIMAMLIISVLGMVALVVIIPRVLVIFRLDLFG